VCQFGAIKINKETGLPEVNDEKCTGCGACVKACPKVVIELRKKAPKFRKVYVSCINKDKGAVAKKACSSACIGCGKCAKTCPFEAITVENNVAYIDFNKCKMCRKCVEQCPTGAIMEENFPPRKPKAEGVAAVDPEKVKVEKPSENTSNQ
jgi:ferredoxin